MFNNQDWRVKLLEAGVMLIVVYMEYWAMQPYHEPVTAKIWLWLSKLCYRIARTFGHFGLYAEHEYYEAF
jgi:hypothetical protein